MLVATSSVFVDVDGARHKLRRGRTTAEEGAPVVVEHPELWEPLVPDFPATTVSGAVAGRPAAGGLKAEWLDYVSSLGGKDLAGLTKDELVERADQLEG